MRQISLILLLFLLGSASSVVAQTFTVRGLVRDVQTGETVRLANVRVSGSFAIARTDDDGYFEVEVPEAGGLLEVFRLGYERGYLRVDAAPEDTVTIGLVLKSVELETVVIEAGLQKVLKNTELFVKDYAFYEDELFVLVFDEERRGFKVAYVNGRDSIVDSRWGPEPPVALEKDCYGNVHAIGEEYACQLFLWEDRIKSYEEDRRLYDTYVRPVQGSIQQYYYYSYRQLNDQILDYYVQNGLTGHGDFFYHLEDERRIQHLLDPHQANPFSFMNLTEAQARGLGAEAWKKMASIDENSQFDQLAFFKPVDAPLHTIGNEVVVFDHLTGNIRKFAPDGLHKDDVPIRYHEQRRWDRFITVDPVRGDAYTRYVHQGVTTLAEIDLATGLIKKRYTLPRQFPKKITVRDGVAYFLYAEANYDDTRRLYRYRLKD